MAGESLIVCIYNDAGEGVQSRADSGECSAHAIRLAYPGQLVEKLGTRFYCQRLQPAGSSELPENDLCLLAFRLFAHPLRPFQHYCRHCLFSQGA